MQEYQIKEESDKIRTKIDKERKEIVKIEKQEKDYEKQVISFKDEMNENEKNIQRQKSRRDSTLEKMQDLRQQMLA